jgi:hypothetical protein
MARRRWSSWATSGCCASCSTTPRRPVSARPRADGRSWSEIAAALDVSRQAVWERWHALDASPTGTTTGAVPGTTDTSREERMMPTIEEVWGRIEAHAGEVFRQKRGASFTYTVAGGCVRPDRTNRLLPRSDFATALELVPSPTTVPFQRLQGPSYVWAILHDPRIRRGRPVDP